MGFKCSGDSLWSGREGGLDSVANGLEVDTPMRRNSLIQQRKLPLDGSPHRRPVPLPETGTAFDVGNEKGDGAGWQLGHWPSPSGLAGM